MRKSKLKKKGPFRVVSSREIYKNPWIRVREDKVIRPDGKRGIFGMVEMTPGVQVVAIDKKGFCYLTKEYHYAVDKITVEVIAGGIDKGESPLVAARRECFEEAGLRAARWYYLGEFSLFSTLISSPQHIFLGLEAEVVSQPHPEDQKSTRIIRVPFERAVRMAGKGDIFIGASMAAILKADHYLRSKKYVFKKSRN